MTQSRSRGFLRTIRCVAADVLRFASSMLRSHAQLAAENLFLRKQLALYLERQIKPRRADGATRLTLIALSRLILGSRRSYHCRDGTNGPQDANAGPQANAFCERLIGTIRRECLDFVIPLNERHVRSVLAEWVAHYNRGRPHASLGPGILDPSDDCLARSAGGHRILALHRVVAKPVLGGLHHEYRLEPTAA